MSNMDSFADCELTESELDLVSGGCGGGRGRGNGRGRGDGNVGGNVITIAGDVIVNGNGSITIVGGDVVTA